MKRYARQTRLAEVGQEGQKRLVAAKVPLASRTPFARTVEERYLRAAGVQISEGTGDAPPDLGLRHAAAAEMGEGALAALVGIRAALGIS